ncbi:Bgt-51095 [Blumeria graminis f. sp. tritici]|uniref:Bgt-51095 n=1 Tax=Blumeria graminis f. sp. tritici TaxID=62690 RepID=A0A9X9L9N0_BLUGR|nr:Bgt-51095 [Blumeria graminis f. sp. tritici]
MARNSSQWNIRRLDICFMDRQYLGRGCKKF